VAWRAGGGRDRRARAGRQIERVIGVVKPRTTSRRVLEKAGLCYAEIRHAYGERLLLYETRALKGGGQSAEA
jgi:hypothetical protein